MANQFGGPTPATSFLVGLASSTMDAFKSDHERELAEDYQAKTIDHDLLMKALQQVQHDDTLTPSQRTAATQEILQRSVDIFKPKGHGGIKDNLKNLFGGGERYQPRGVGDILTKQRPKLDVQASIPEGAASVTDSSGVTLPLPPRPAVDYTVPGAEPTFRELDQSDEVNKQGAIMQRQLAVEHQRGLQRAAERKTQNDAVSARMRERFHLKSDEEANLLIKRQLSKLGLFEDTPENRAIAAEDYRQEHERKVQDQQVKLLLNQKRIQGIDASIVAGQERLKQGWARVRVSQARQESFNNDPQVKGSWVKVREYAGLAKTARTQAAILRGKFATTGNQVDLDYADELEKDAEGHEQKVQQIMNAIQERQDELGARSGAGVSLPSPPVAGENSKIRAYANKYFKGDYAAADAYAKAHP